MLVAPTITCSTASGFAASTEFADKVTNFDANGTADRVEFGGGLNTAWDDGLANDNFLFVSSNGGTGAVAATVGQGNANAEALRLTGVNGEGTSSATLGSAAAVATAFNKEFSITAANGEDALLVVNDTNGKLLGLATDSGWQRRDCGFRAYADRDLRLERNRGHSLVRLHLISARSAAGGAILAGGAIHIQRRARLAHSRLRRKKPGVFRQRRVEPRLANRPCFPADVVDRHAFLHRHARAAASRRAPAVGGAG